MAEVQHCPDQEQAAGVDSCLSSTLGYCAKVCMRIKKSHLLSRSIAAAAIKILAEVDCSTASGAIVDGGKDNGIDAIYYDGQTKTCF